MLELNEIDEFKLDAYENTKLYKERTTLWHDKHILVRHFEPIIKYYFTTLNSDFFLKNSSLNGSGLSL